MPEDITTNILLDDSVMYITINTDAVASLTLIKPCQSDPTETHYMDFSVYMLTLDLAPNHKYNSGEVLEEKNVIWENSRVLTITRPDAWQTI